MVIEAEPEPVGTGVEACATRVPFRRRIAAAAFEPAARRPKQAIDNTACLIIVCFFIRYWLF
jgi:hypothetical protein